VPFGHAGQKAFCIGWDPTPSTHKLKKSGWPISSLVIYLFDLIFHVFFPTTLLCKKKTRYEIGVQFFYFIKRLPI
jgi:hypothetical protein